MSVCLQNQCYTGILKLEWKNICSKYYNICLDFYNILLYNNCIEGDFVHKYYVEIDTTSFEQDGEIEIIDAPVSWQELFDTTIGPPKKEYFYISRPEQLANFIRVIGGPHGPVAEYLIRQKDGRNSLIVTNRELAAATGVSLATTNTLLQRLRAAGCIRCKTGALMVNPGVSHVGNRQREAFLWKLYEKF